MYLLFNYSNSNFKNIALKQNKRLSLFQKGAKIAEQKRQASLFRLASNLYDELFKNAAGYPRLPPLPPCFAPVLRLRVDKFSSLVFKKRDILSSKLSFDLKLPFE